MSKLYNTQGDISTNLFIFFSNLTLMSKPLINNLSIILTSMIAAESCVTHDIAKNIKNSSTLLDSLSKRIRRFFNNSKLDIYSIYHLFIKHIISNFSPKHSDKRVHIIFDHVFIKKRFTVILFSLRIGKSSIPLWFRCFKAIPEEAFTTDLLKQGILYCKNLFVNHDVNLIYLGDRGFFTINLFKYFDELNISFNIRISNNALFRPIHGEFKGHTMTLKDIPINLKHSKFFYNCFLTNQNYRCNIAVSRTIILEHNIELDDIWYVATNSDPKRAIKDYGYRFGGIETVFKNMKTNGFYLEKTLIRNLHAFTSLFGIICIALSWMTIIGSDLGKNRKNKLIGATKKVKGKFIRVLSLFNAGLTWFHKCYYTSFSLFKLKYSFILYDT